MQMLYCMEIEKGEGIFLWIIAKLQVLGVYQMCNLVLAYKRYKAQALEERTSSFVFFVC